MSIPLHHQPLLDTLGRGCLRPGGLALTERLFSLAALPRKARVLDLGCGLGATAAFLAEQGLDVVGVDVDASLVCRAALRHPGVRFEVADAAALPFPDGAFQGAFLECTLSVLACPAAALTELARVLAPGAPLAVSDLYARRAQGVTAARAEAAGLAPSLLTRAGLEARLREAGFEVVLVEDCSRALAALLGQLILERGSARPLWDAVCTHPGGGPRAEAAWREARPGYLLLVARQGAAPSPSGGAA